MVASVPVAWSSARALAGLLFLAGLMLLILTPPFQVPDEPNHLLRAYQLSEGTVRTSVYGGRRGGVLPEPLVDAAENGFVELRARAGVRTSLREWRATLVESARLESLDTASRRIVTFPNTAQYSPVPYLPAMTGLWIGRTLGIDAYGLLYLARFATLITSVLIVFASLRLLEDQPRARLVLFLMAGAPMALFLFAGCSADAVTNALGLLVLASSLTLWRRWSAAVFAALLAASALLSLCKGIYLLLPLAAAPALAGRRRDGHAALGAAAAVVVAAFLPGFLWSQTLAPGAVRGAQDVRINPTQWLRSDPFGTVFAVVRDVVHGGARYGSEMVGVLGWLDTKLPLFARLGYVALLFAAALVGARAWDQEEAVARTQAPLQRLTLAAIAVATVLLLYLVALATWSWTGPPQIRGLQGRYFLPAAPLLLLALPTVRELGLAQHRRFAIAALIAWGLAMLVTGFSLAARYWA